MTSLHSKLLKNTLSFIAAYLDPRLEFHHKDSSDGDNREEYKTHSAGSVGLDVQRRAGGLVRGSASMVHTAIFKIHSIIFQTNNCVPSFAHTQNIDIVEVWELFAGISKLNKDVSSALNHYGDLPEGLVQVTWAE